MRRRSGHTPIDIDMCRTNDISYALCSATTWFFVLDVTCPGSVGNSILVRHIGRGKGGKGVA